MRKQHKVFRKELIVLLLAFIFTIMFIPTKSYADEISFAVSPSKIVDYQIEPGETKEIIFSMGNKSIFPEEHTEKNELYNIKVSLSMQLEDSDEIELDYKDILTLDKSSMEAKPGKADEVKLIISIPEDFEKNYYRAFINFTREPIEGVENSDGGAYSSIKVPIYLLVGDESEFSKLKADYDILKFNVNFGEDNNPFSKVIINNLFGLIKNPFKTINEFKNIKNRPIYAITQKDKVVVDVNNEMLVEASKVVTNKKINEWKYIKASNEQLNQKVKNVKFNNKEVNFELENNDVITLEGSTSTISFVKNQMNNILKNIAGMPILSNLLNEIKVPINKTYEIFDYSSFMEIENTGEKNINITANLSLVKDNSTLIGEGTLNPLTVMVNKKEEISVPLKINGDLTNGDYNLTGDFYANKINKAINYKYKVDNNLSQKIFITTLVVYILILVLIISMIIVIFKVLNKKIKTRRKQD